MSEVKITKKVGYVDTPILKECGTCKYIDQETRRICGNDEVKADMEVPHDKDGNPIVNAHNGCCDEWKPRTQKSLGSRLIALG